MTDEHLSTLPLLASIALTATVLATVIAWQATGVPIVALLLVPWLLVMFALALPQASMIGHKPSGQSPARRRVVAAGMATVAVAAALTTAGDWSDAVDADPSTTSGLTVASEATATVDAGCGALIQAVAESQDR